MLIKKPFQTWAAALVTVALTAGAYADTITLKDGTKIEGTVQSENDKEVVIEEKISAGITDVRTVSKSSIAKVDKIAEDVPAFQAIKNLKPGPNSMPASSYDQAIRSLNSFITSFPQSAHVAEVKQQLAAWEEERKKVEGGEVKINHKWLSKEEAEKEKYQIGGQILFAQMQQQYRQSDFAGALNTFDQLERTFPGARSFPDAVEGAKTILPSFKAAADRTLQQSKFQKAEREKGVQLLSEPQKSQTIAAMKREEQQAQAAVDAASRAGLKWPPLVANETALTTISTRVPEEQRRLAELPVAKMKQSVQLADKARGLIAEKKFDDAEQTLRQAVENWNVNEAATRLQNELGTLRTASATPETTTTTDTPAPETPAAAPAPTASSSSETASTEESPSNTSENSADESAAAEEPSFFGTLYGKVIIVVLAILTLTGFMAFRKISKKSSEVIE